MTHLQSAHRARPHAGIVASAALTTLNFQSLRRHRVRPDITADLPKTAVCVLVPKAEINDETALKLLAGSTMNGRYVDEAAAKKLLAELDLTTAAPAKNAPKQRGAGTNTLNDIDGSKVGLGGFLSISHHREPRRTIGLKRRGQHLALDD